MGGVTLTLPRLGETMEEARVAGWLVAPGEAFARGAVLLEVETDKTVVEVPALASGVMRAHLVAPGALVALGQPIAEIVTEPTGAGAAATAPPPTKAKADPHPDPEPGPEPGPAIAPLAAASAGSRVAASPAARAAARRRGLALAEVTGSGRRGRITAEDVARSRVGPATAADSAPAFLLLHGLFDHPQGGWRDLSRRLAAAGQAVHVPALAGHAPDSPAIGDLGAAAQQLAAGLPAGRLRLIGHSLGAALAVRLAQDLGPRVERLILSAPVGLGARINADFIDGLLAAETPAALARALELLGGGPLSPLALRQEGERLHRQRAGHAALAARVARGGFQQLDIRADLARLSCPVTVLFGTADRVLDWRDVAALPASAAIHLVAGAGHLPHLAAPELILRLALAELPPDRGGAAAPP